MDIKAKIEQIVSKIKSDKNLSARFAKEPVAVVEELIGVDLPDDQIEKVVDGVKAKIKLDQVGDVLEGLGKLFNK